MGSGGNRKAGDCRRARRFRRIKVDVPDDKIVEHDECIDRVAGDQAACSGIDAVPRHDDSQRLKGHGLDLHMTRTEDVHRKRRRLCARRPGNRGVPKGDVLDADVERVGDCEEGRRQRPAVAVERHARPLADDRDVDAVRDHVGERRLGIHRVGTLGDTHRIAVPEVGERRGELGERAHAHLARRKLRCVKRHLPRAPARVRAIRPAPLRRHVAAHEMRSEFGSLSEVRAVTAPPVVCAIQIVDALVIEIH